MQSEAFPTPPIYGYLFQPRLIEPFSPFKDVPKIVTEVSSDSYISDRVLKKLRFHSSALKALLDDIEALAANCSSEEAQLFWSAFDHLQLMPNQEAV